MHINIHIHIYIYIYTYTYIFTCVHIYTHIHNIYIYIYAYKYVYTYIYTYIHIHIYSHVYTYIHIYTHQGMRPRSGPGYSRVSTAENDDFALADQVGPVSKKQSFLVCVSFEYISRNRNDGFGACNSIKSILEKSTIFFYPF